MPAFRVEGTGRDSGRKRRRVYQAVSEDDARRKAEADGTAVVDITEIPPPPPSEGQVAYATSLGIDLPLGVSAEEVSDLISTKLHKDKIPADRDLRFARQHGVLCTPYTGKRELYNRIFVRLCQPGSEEDLAAWFAFRVHRESHRHDPYDEVDSPDHPKIREIARTLAAERSVIKSIRRYRGSDLRWFGVWTSHDGWEHEGGSNQTVAYRRAASLVRGKEAGEPPIESETSLRLQIEDLGWRNQSKPKAAGCLSVVLLGAVICAVVIGGIVHLVAAA